MGRGPHEAGHDFLCSPRKPQANNLTLSSLLIVVISKKNVQNLGLLRFWNEKGDFGH